MKCTHSPRSFYDFVILSGVEHFTQSKQLFVFDFLGWERYLRAMQPIIHVIILPYPSFDLPDTNPAVTAARIIWFLVVSGFTLCTVV
jgi:hypothetical protein